MGRRVTCQRTHTLMKFEQVPIGGNSVKLFILLAFAFLTTTAQAAEPFDTADVPPASAELATLYTSPFRQLEIDPDSVVRGSDGSFTLIVYSVFSHRAHEMGLIPQNVVATSGRARIDCAEGTYRILTNHEVDVHRKIVGEVGDAGAGGLIPSNTVVAEIARYMCKVHPGVRGKSVTL